MSNILKNIVIKLAIWLIKISIRKGSKGKIEVKASLVNKQDLFITNIAFLILFAKFGIRKELILSVINNNKSLPPANYQLTGGELFRHEIMQKYYLAIGLSKTKYSKHQDRLAIDLNLFKDGKFIDGSNKKEQQEAYKPLAEYWQSLNENNVSGYNWNWDFNHFQTN